MFVLAHCKCLRWFLQCWLSYHSTKAETLVNLSVISSHFHFMRGNVISKSQQVSQIMFTLQNTTTQSHHLKLPSLVWSVASTTTTTNTATKSQTCPNSTIANKQNSDSFTHVLIYAYSTTHTHLVTPY